MNRDPIDAFVERNAKMVARCDAVVDVLFAVALGVIGAVLIVHWAAQ